MEEDTKKLLEECNSGSKMAIRSIEQISDYIEEEKLKKLILEYKEKHEKIEKESSELLEDYGQEEKEPGTIATAFSWFTTEMKLIMKNDSSQIAKLMMDGCNMGIQSISKYQNECVEASKESVSLAKDLVKIEEKFMKELKGFL